LLVGVAGAGGDATDGVRAGAGELWLVQDVDDIPQSALFGQALLEPNDRRAHLAACLGTTQLVALVDRLVVAARIDPEES